MPLPLAEAPSLDVSRVRPAVLAKGFRPFFLLAAAWAVVAMPMWLLVLAGRLRAGTYLPGPLWHAHEMLFGFTVAVVAGFLLTAIANWTQEETATGLPLAALAVACARPILRTRNRRNYQFVAMLIALFAANLLVHLGAHGIGPARIGAGHRLATHVFVVMMLVVTGRIVPLFTRNATRAEGIRNLPAFDRLAVGGTIAIAVLDLAAAPESLIGVVAAVTAAGVVGRTRHWGLRHTARHPLLWVLHAGHLWIAVGLALRALGAAGLVPAAGSTALRAFTGGAIATLTLGMMTRVTLGHTGRPLAASPAMTLAFVLVGLGGAVRIAAPWVGPRHWLPAMTVAGVLFSIAFALYLVRHTPMLLAPRPDGRPG